VTKADLLRERMTRASDDPEPFWEIVDEDVEWDISDWTFGGDKVVRFKSFRSREAALREAGIDRQ
jgi:hypothetical protein